MLRLWLYCSYKGSPTGFKLCSVDMTEGREASDHSGLLTGTDTVRAPGILDRCFSAQEITGAYGRLPEGDTYVVLKKIPADPQAGELILNFAFETDDTELFQRLIRAVADERSVYLAIQAAIEIDPGDMAYGYHLKYDRMAENVKRLLSDKETAPRGSADSGAFFVQSRTVGKADFIEKRLSLERLYPQAALVTREERAGSGRYIIKPETASNFYMPRILVKALVTVLALAAMGGVIYMILRLLENS